MENNARVMWGIVNKNGTIASGKGFLVERVDNGLYSIIFETDHVFNAAPGVSVTQVYAGGNGHGGDTRDNAVIVYIQNDRFRIKTGNNQGNAEDRDFTFIVAGV